MRQTLHIFQKDIRYLRYDLYLVLALEVIFGWMSARHVDTVWIQTLLPIAASYLIVRLIHAEAIPGDRQFCITRPYRWKSLAAAKILFILLFIELPVFAVQFLILVVEGFPLGYYLPALLWSQVLLTFAVWLPIAALASMTKTFVSFTFSLLILVAVVIGTQQLFFVSDILRSRQFVDPWPGVVQWVRISIPVCA